MAPREAAASGITRPFVSDIDGLRGLFAFVVLVGHAFDIAGLYAGRDALGFVLAGARPFIGFVWVVGFVVLSGFCIELSCRRKTSFSAREYVLHRVTRIYPLLVVCALVAGAVELAIYDSPLRPGVWGAGITPAHFVANLWGISRAGFGKRIPLAFLVNAALVTAVLLLPAEGFALLPRPLAAIFQRFILLIYLPWLIGAATASFLERLEGTPALQFLANWAWPLLFVLLGLGWLLYRLPAFTVDAPSFGYYVLLGAAFARRGQRRASRFKKFLGQLSYPLYLVHGPVIVGTGWESTGWARSSRSPIISWCCSARRFWPPSPWSCSWSGR